MGLIIISQAIIIVGLVIIFQVVIVLGFEYIPKQYSVLDFWVMNEFMVYWAGFRLLPNSNIRLGILLW